MDPRFQKKVFGLKNFTPINKLTLKTVINEQLNTKTSNKPPKKYKNALIRPYYILYIQLDRESEDQMVHYLYTRVDQK